MGKTAKVIVFIIVSVVILFTCTVIKDAGVGNFMWLGTLAAWVMYRSMFGKNKKHSNNSNSDITLDKGKQNDNNITLNK